MSFRVPESKRITRGVLRSDPSIGNNGAFEFRLGQAKFLAVASNQGGWEHVSVSITESAKQRCPTWEEMCLIKEMFWGEDDCVVQYHPAKKDYVNNHPYCLHLWRSTDTQIACPPSWMVGVKS